MDKNNNHENEDGKKMTEEEYLKSDPEYNEIDDKMEEESNDLPSTFLMEEKDYASDLNVFIMPKYDLNVDLIIENYLEAIVNSSTKSSIKTLLKGMWQEAKIDGIMSERISRFQAEAQIMEAEMEAYKYGIVAEREIVTDESEFLDDYPEFPED